MATPCITPSPEEVKHLALLGAQETPVIEEFCKQVHQFINEDQKISPKMINSAAKKLAVSSIEVIKYVYLVRNI